MRDRSRWTTRRIQRSRTRSAQSTVSRCIRSLFRPAPVALDARITWDAVDQPKLAPAHIVRSVGCSRRLSMLQGNGGFGEATVHDPAPGTWTCADLDSRRRHCFQWAVMWSFLEPVVLVGGAHRPGEHEARARCERWFRVTVPYPAHTGDLVGDLRMSTGGADDGGIPVTVRAYVPLPPGSGVFSGVLTGGNGRRSSAATTRRSSSRCPRSGRR